MPRRSSLALFILTALIQATSLLAAGPPCFPCAGITVADPLSAVVALEGTPRLGEEARLYVRWEVELDGSVTTTAADRVAAAGATSWYALVFRTPAPLVDHLDALARELEVAAGLARSAPDGTHFQILWRPATTDEQIEDLTAYAFVLKRAAVAISGARGTSRIITAPLLPDASVLQQLYAAEVAAYLDGIALRPAAPEVLKRAVDALTELDPGRAVVIDGLSLPAVPAQALVRAAEHAAAGAAVTLFRADVVDAGALAPLAVLANELCGDLSFDPYLKPEGANGAWPFVRGSDLGLRIIVDAGEAPERLVLLLPDQQLRDVTRVDLGSGASDPGIITQRTAAGLKVEILEPRPVELLRVERMTAAELEAFAAQVDVAGERQMPVEEILRRLQASEDAQERRLHHYQGVNTTHLRFRPSAGVDTVEVTFEGPFFSDRDQGQDWVWKDFRINGVRWRSTRVPEFPLVQPEKAATLPLLINFTKEYEYRLRGTDQVDGRDCWVVDFEPLAPGSGLHQGTVWIDRALYVRVRSRAAQTGLEGLVVSNEETIHFTPLDASGAAVEWSSEAFILPTQIVAQQLQSVLSSTLQMERETVLSSIRINGEDFEDARRQAYASDLTMVRDTQAGLRYLEKTDDQGHREVREGFDPDHLFLLGGAFYDRSLDFPLPLAGLDYFTFDLASTGAQANLFFAGVIVNGSIAQPRLFGSSWKAGARLNALVYPFDEELYRNGKQVEEENVRSNGGGLALYVGRPLGNFLELDLEYNLGYENFARADETADEFVVPTDTLTHTVTSDLRYQRSGYTLALTGSFTRRSEWEAWGLPGNDEFDPDQQEYVRWRVALAKTWWLPRFMKAGVVVDHLDGDELDRFSKYEFGFFGSSRVSGYQSGLVTASEGDGIHLNWGFNLGDVLQVGVNGDAVWATDEATGLDRELLAGASVAGNIIGPWETLMAFDIGVPLAGPADGFVAQIYFLRRFR